MQLNQVLFGLVSLVTHVVEGITGFGSTVLALPFGIALVGVAAAVPTLSLQGWLLSVYVVCTDRKKIVWRQYAIILSLVLLGMPLGMLAFTRLPEAVLKLILACFMVGVSVHGLGSKIRGKGEPEALPTGARRIALYLLLLLGGMIHGAFSSGGPLLILYVTRAIRDKGQFRATMCALWFTLNLILLVRNIATGLFTPEVMHLSVVSLPFLIAGTLLGTLAHKRISDGHFVYIVYGVLLLSGGFLAYNALAL